MSEPKHTSGPWSQHPYSSPDPMSVICNDTTFSYATITVGAGDKIVAHVQFQTNSTAYPHVDRISEFQANAQLISAAPELLNELQQFVNGVSTGLIDSPADEALANITCRARAAIAKATGGNWEEA